VGRFLIITQTPLRISLAGGGTDFAGFYEKHGGAVLSTAIDKFIYVIIKARFDEKIRVGYTRTEMVDSLDQIEHELVRECLRHTGLKEGLEIATMADIPSEGSGLGSSSTVTVGLLHAMYTYKGELVTAERLAEEACHIEIDILKKPIGKQDQYIAAFGGIRKFTFQEDGLTHIRAIEIGEEQGRRLGEVLLLFYTGITRKADSILAEQKNNIVDQEQTLLAMKAQVEEMEISLQTGSFHKAARILHAGWEMKKALANKISSSTIDDLYEKALDAGATGGKIAGAGGGGFLLVFCPPDRQIMVRNALAELKELPFHLERDGSKVIFNNRRT
jgi:D-glycero-alpha-D-manno-heptose-7-phosphate kinase